MTTTTTPAASIAKITCAFLLSVLLRTANAADVVHVKLAPGFTSTDIQDMGPVITPLFTLPYDRLKALCEVEPGLPDLTLWYRVVLTKDDAAASTTGNNEEQEEADFVLQANIVAQYDGAITDVVIPKIVPPPGETPDFTANQNYLLSNSATDNGIDAEYSWTFPGGDGEGITIYDVEYAWNLQHEDLIVMKDVKELVNDLDTGFTTQPDDHGTAVLGELVGTSNSFGVTGISPGAKARIAPEQTEQLGSDRANAIMLAVDDALKDGIPNDVILLEMQMTACGMLFGIYGPAEEQLDVFDATRVAVASGIVVVAAAGNGDLNLDHPACLGKYDRAVRDSGAIIVGAGGSGRVGCSPARQKMSFSSYGSRVDVQGWGECVWTTGYGTGYKDPEDIDDKNKWYRATFGGTSSASPIVAAAVANIQGIAIQAFGAPLKPKDVRQLLSDTGFAQEGDISEHIGPLVNLRGAIDKLLLSQPTTSTPTSNPTTNAPTSNPTATRPTTSTPTSNPTSTTAAPTSAPTSNPTISPTTLTSNPTTATSSQTMSPTASSTLTSNPTTAATNNAATSNPTTLSASKSSKQATKSSKSKLSAPKSKASK